MASFLLLFIIYFVHRNAYCMEITGVEMTIVNPKSPDHEIPIHLSIPVANSLNTTASFPLLLFMHGVPCYWWWYEYLAEYVAPNGYVVGLLASYEPIGTFTGMAIDMRYCLDYLYNQSMYNESSGVYNKLSYTSIVGGHSMGADAALLALGEFADQSFEHRFDAVYAMAAANTFEVKRAINYMQQRDANKAFIFLISASSDCIAPPSKSEAIYKEINEDICSFYGVIVNGTHCHFADIFVIDNECYKVEENECSLNEKNRTVVPREIQLELTRNYLLQFMNAALMNQKGSQTQQQDFDALYNDMATYQLEGYVANVTHHCTVFSW